MGEGAEGPRLSRDHPSCSAKIGDTPPLPPVLYPTLLLPHFVPQFPQWSPTARMGVQTLTSVCAHVSLGVPTGSAPTSPPSPQLCAGLGLPRDHPWAPPHPQLWGGGAHIPASHPCNKEPLSLCWDEGGASGSGSRRDPPFPPPASGLLSSASGCCQEAAGRFPPHPLGRMRPSRPSPLPGEPVCPPALPCSGDPSEGGCTPMHIQGWGWILDSGPVCSKARRGGEGIRRQPRACWDGCVRGWEHWGVWLAGGAAGCPKPFAGWGWGCLLTPGAGPGSARGC